MAKDKLMIKFVDKGWLKIVSEVSKLDGLAVEAGVNGAEGAAEHGDSGQSVAFIAMVQEFGTEQVPDRPFIRPALAWDGRSALAGRMAAAAAAVCTGRLTAWGAMQGIGVFSADRIREKLWSQVGPENAPSTVAKKMQGMTLRDSFQMANAIGYQIISKTVAAILDGSIGEDVEIGGE